jgi:MFS family permease
MAGKWLNRNILLISLSAFFADSGYQILIAGLPLFLVLTLNAPVYIFGIVTAIAYGIGAIFSYYGGILADKYGKLKMAILGNSLIPILSFTGFGTSIAEAASIFSAGWWMRNFRTPARRALQADESTPENRSKAFGFLHALDIGGVLTATALLMYFLYIHLAFKYIFLFSIIPLAVSTLCLVLVKPTKHKDNIAITRKAAAKHASADAKAIKINSNVFKGVLIAAALYGFSSYSLGFPILTIAQSSNDIYGVFAYAVMMGISAIVGFTVGNLKVNKIKALGIGGYVLAAAGSLLLGVAYLLNANLYLFYIAAAMLGFSLGFIETFEPTIISLIAKPKKEAKGFGMLSSSRSIGFFVSNILMGLLYMASPFYSYLYAAVIALAAGIIILASGIGSRI